MNTVKVLFFGDSFLLCPGLAQEYGWPHLVRDHLVQHFKSQPAVKIVISAVSGENTRGGLERMQKDVQFIEPDIVVVQYGTNDSTHWLSNRGAPIVSQGAFRANLEEIIDRCRRFSITRVLLVTNHPVALERYDINGLTPDQNTAVYDQISREIAARHGCFVADMRAACSNLDPRTICQDDLIHVNHYGAQLYAEAANPHLIALISGLLHLNSAEIPENSYD